MQPCDLVSGHAATALDVLPGIPSGNIQLGTATCVWAHRTPHPDNTWLARALLHTPAEAATNDPHHNQIVTIGGFPAVQTTTSDGDPNRTCEERVDVADHQTLMVDYINGAEDPPIDHQIACQRAAQAAALMVEHLNALPD